MLASMCRDQLIESQFVLQKVATPTSNTDSLGGRPEGSTKTHAPFLAPTTAPAAPPK
jgi:hypothetical protein